MKKIIRLGAILILGAAVLGFLQALLVPKYMESSREGALIAEYYDNSGKNDVIFIGDCEVYENISPITLWEEYGVTSYIRGSAQQMIWQSYYLMEETLRYETPEVIVFNVLSMMYDTPQSTGSQSQREAYNRMTLDGMRWSSSKWKSIRASMTEEEQTWEAMYSYVFPLLRFHDRWHQLTKEDITYWLRRDQVSHNGYLMQTGVKPYTTPYVERPRISYEFGENSWYYLEKMAALCRENGVELVLLKAPSLYPTWWPQWDQQIEDFAAENNLTYMNMLDYQEEIGIDWQTDTYDAGLHLNVYGAEKASLWFGAQLTERYDLVDHREDPEYAALWKDKVSRYEEEKSRQQAENRNRRTNHEKIRYDDRGAVHGNEHGCMWRSRGRTAFCGQPV